MRRLFIVPIMVALTAGVCAAQAIENAAIEREEYAVYSAMMPAVYGEFDRGFMLIANPTRGSYQVSKKDLQFFAPAPVVTEQTLGDFFSRNKTNRWLTRKFDLPVDYALAPFEEIKRLIGFSLTLEDWKGFFKQYPGAHAFIRLSRVGFDHQLNQALVYVGWRCPGLCGQSEFILLEKNNHVWKVVNRANREVS